MLVVDVVRGDRRQAAELVNGPRTEGVEELRTAAQSRGQEVEEMGRLNQSS